MQNDLEILQLIGENLPQLEIHEVLQQVPDEQQAKMITMDVQRTVDQVNREDVKQILLAASITNHEYISGQTYIAEYLIELTDNLQLAFRIYVFVIEKLYIQTATQFYETLCQLDDSFIGLLAANQAYLDLRTLFTKQVSIRDKILIHLLKNIDKNQEEQYKIAKEIYRLSITQLQVKPDQKSIFIDHIDL